MNQRLETLKKARERMLEDQDAHTKVLAAPLDRDKAERARNKVCRNAGADRRTEPGDPRRGRLHASAITHRLKFQFHDRLESLQPLEEKRSIEETT
jgi:hypothetical protein